MPRSVDLFAVQPYVTAETYRSEAAFRGAMERMVARCVEIQRRAGGDPPPALVVFPENIGTFLALAPLGRLGPHLRHSAAAAALALPLRPSAFFRALAHASPRRLEIIALLTFAPEVRAVYERTFGSLARQSGMTVVAGSALLPDGDGHVYNLSLTFDPQGHTAQVTHKVHLVPELEDTLGLTPGTPTDLRPADVPVGRVGTLICYDGFAVPHTQHEPGFRAVGRQYVDQGVQILAQPAANSWPWDGPWLYRPSGSKMLRREQWRTEGLEAQLSGLEGVRYAVTAHLLGRVLDQRFDGRSAIYERRDDGSVITLAEAQGADASPSAEEVVHARVEAPWL